MTALVERRPGLCAFAAFFVVAAAVRAGDYAAPLSGDIMQFLYVGKTVGHGGMPYADAAFNKGPLTAIIFAAVDQIAGGSRVLVRLTVVPFLAASAVAIAGYIACYAGRLAGAVSGLAVATFSGILDFWTIGGETEHYGVAPLFGALWFAARRGTWNAAGAGALAACAVLIHPALAVGVPAVVLELASSAGQRRHRTGAACLGAAVPMAISIGWLAIGGALDDMVTQVARQIDRALRLADANGGFPSFGGMIALNPAPRLTLSGLTVPVPALWLVAGLSAALAMREPRFRRPAVTLVLIACLTVLRVKVAYYEFGYQYFTALPALCGLIGLGIASTWRGRIRERLALAVLVLAVPVWVFAIQPQRELLRLRPAERNPLGAIAYPVAAFLRAHTNPSDRIMVAGSRADLYWLADRRAPTRFFDDFGLSGVRSYRPERLRDLKRTPPRAVVLLKTERISADPDLEWLVSRDRYRVAYRRAGSVIWLRRDAVAAKSRPARR